MDGAVRRIAAADRGEAVATAGMTREEAVSTEGMWAGFARTEAGSVSGWHHHGEFESAIYVLSGALRMEFGTYGSDVVEAGPGDFVYVQKGVIHRESNPTDHAAEMVVVRSGAGQAVFNVDGPEDH